MTNSNQPYVILVEPQLAENVGMAARAMMNCGLYNMRLVNPREDHLSAKAISASSNAEEILENAEIFGSTADAIADLHYVAATTARHRDQTKQVFTADRAGAELNNKQRRNEPEFYSGRSGRDFITMTCLWLMQSLTFRSIRAIVRLICRKRCFWPAMSFTKPKFRLRKSSS